MEKKGKSIFSKVLLVIIIVVLFNIGIFFYRYKIVGKAITGLSVIDTIIEAYTSMPIYLRVFIISQWFILLLILAFVTLKGKGGSKKKELEGINLKKISKNSKTDLDTLYNVLKIKKHLRISSIAKLFDVSEEVATGWSRTLEDGNLVTIESSTTAEPIVKIIEE